MLKVLNILQSQFSRLTLDERGQGLTEYALLITLIAVVAITALSLLGSKVTTELSTIARSV